MTPILWVAGGRDYGNRQQMMRALDRYGPEWTLITGAAPGADALAEEVWRDWGRVYVGVPADWNLHGRAAGPIRNRRIVAEYKPDSLLWFPGGKGTADAIKAAQEGGMTTIVNGEES